MVSESEMVSWNGKHPMGTVVKERWKRPGVFKSPPLTKPLESTYITLWLNQVHMWFGADRIRIANFVSEAKKVGFTSIMTDVPWAWSERESPGLFDFRSHDKHWVDEVCAKGMKLHLVLRADEFPPWMTTIDREELGEREYNRRKCGKVHNSPSMGSDKAMGMVISFFEKAVEYYSSTYGACILSFNPTINNELETRYSMVNDCQRDFNPQMLLKFEQWQQNHGGGDDPILPRDREYGKCTPQVNKEDYMWWEFRTQVIAERYNTFCSIIANRNQRCLLHIGEFLSTSDRINTNALQMLLAMPQITDLTIDSNMALWGAPSSPSIVGALIDAARTADKIIHFEAATERILPCDERGRIVLNGNDHNVLNAAKMMYGEAISRSLESGVDALGFTNLCEPHYISDFISAANFSALHTIRSARSSSIVPTAILYIPYRALYAYTRSISGVFCSIPEVPCWHPSFMHIPPFGYGKRRPNHCAQDIIQFQLLEIWDSMRMRHERVKLVLDAACFDESLLREVKEFIHVEIKGVKWDFFNGQSEKNTLETLLMKYNSFLSISTATISV